MDLLLPALLLVALLALMIAYAVMDSLGAAGFRPRWKKGRVFVERMPLQHGEAGRTARVLGWTGDRGFVWFEGERWQARSAQTGLSPGLRVRVTDREGLVLVVTPCDGSA